MEVQNEYNDEARRERLAKTSTEHKLKKEQKKLERLEKKQEEKALEDINIPIIEDVIKPKEDVVLEPDYDMEYDMIEASDDSIEE